MNQNWHDTSIITAFFYQAEDKKMTNSRHSWTTLSSCVQGQPGQLNKDCVKTKSKTKQSKEKEPSHVAQ